MDQLAPLWRRQPGASSLQRIVFEQRMLRGILQRRKKNCEYGMNRHHSYNFDGILVYDILRLALFRIPCHKRKYSVTPPSKARFQQL